MAEGGPRKPAGRRVRDAALWFRLLEDRTAGAPGATVAALVDLVRNPGEYQDFDAALTFLEAMGLSEAQRMARERFGGLHPLDDRAHVSPARLARHFGANAKMRLAAEEAQVQSNPAAALDQLRPGVKLAGQCARELSTELLRALDDFVEGRASESVRRRRMVVRRWNRVVDQAGPDFTYPRLCTHCGRPLVMVAKEILRAGKLTSAQVHPACRNAARLAARRATAPRR